MSSRTKKVKPASVPIEPQDQPGTTHFDAVDVPVALQAGPEASAEQTATPSTSGDFGQPWEPVDLPAKPRAITVEPKDMRFYCLVNSAEPVGHKATHRMYGKPRKSHSLAEAEKACGWPRSALVALHQATYPPDAGRDDPRLDEFAEALWDEPVRDALLFFADRLGTTPPATFLLALLLDWDATDDDGKADALVEAAGVVSCPNGSWSKASSAEPNGVTMG